MISRGFKFVLLGLLIAGALVTFAGYRFKNVKLRQRFVDLRRQEQEAVRLREENQQVKARVALFASDEAGAAKALRADVDRLRSEVAALEQRAVERRTAHLGESAAEADALANNRDPAKGLMRAEFAVNAGRATPGAAFQTLIWAAMKGEDDAMAAAVTVTGRTREKAEALLAELPAEARAKYPTPEKLAALFFANGILEELHSFQVLDHTATDATHAKLRVRFPGARKESSVPMALGPDGWRIVIGEKQIDMIRARLLGPPVRPN
jgi:hypothetical protein